MLPSSPIAATEIASLTLDGVATLPSSSLPPSFPAAATTYTPFAIACLTAFVVGPSLDELGSLSPPNDREMMSASNVFQHQSMALATTFWSPLFPPSPSSPFLAEF